VNPQAGIGQKTNGSLALVPETMIEVDDGTRLRTWTSGPVIPQGLPVVMVHGGPGIPDYLAPWPRPSTIIAWPTRRHGGGVPAAHLAVDGPARPTPG
jgi:hypothetical protein